MTEFIPALAGGILIGLASLIATAASGKIPGISGIFGRLLRAPKGDSAWRLIFLVGLIAGAAIAFAVSDHAAVFRPLRPLWVMIVAGLLVGLGTRIGGGCTSGHGVCGMGLGARDSIVATLTFMAAAIVTVALLKLLPLAAS
jgi:uncharacterized membrane protein YedE/YeeE